MAITGPSTTVVFETPAGLIHCGSTPLPTPPAADVRQRRRFSCTATPVVHVDGLGALTVDAAFGGDSTRSSTPTRRVGCRAAARARYSAAGHSGSSRRSPSSSSSPTHSAPEIDRPSRGAVDHRGDQRRHAPPRRRHRRRRSTDRRRHRVERPAGSGPAARVQVGESVQFAGVCWVRRSRNGDDGGRAGRRHAGRRAADRREAHITARSTVIVDRDDPSPPATASALRRPWRQPDGTRIRHAPAACW